jgi:hypothetical protein
MLANVVCRDWLLQQSSAAVCALVEGSLGTDDLELEFSARVEHVGWKPPARTVFGALRCGRLPVVSAAVSRPAGPAGARPRAHQLQPRDGLTGVAGAME